MGSIPIPLGIQFLLIYYMFFRNSMKTDSKITNSFTKGNNMLEDCLNSTIHLIPGSASFPGSQNHHIIALMQWQYWWWFWFSMCVALYYSVSSRMLNNRLGYQNPKIVTSYRSHGRWGDLIICFIPIFWCINILSSSHFLLRALEWQTETSPFTLRVRGKQWYWVYKYELNNTLKLDEMPKLIGRDRKVYFKSTHVARHERVLKTTRSKYFDSSRQSEALKKSKTFNSGDSNFYQNKINFTRKNYHYDNKSLTGGLLSLKKINIPFFYKKSLVNENILVVRDPIFYFTVYNRLSNKLLGTTKILEVLFTNHVNNYFDKINKYGMYLKKSMLPKISSYRAHGTIKSFLKKTLLDKFIFYKLAHIDNLMFIHHKYPNGGPNSCSDAPHNRTVAVLNRLVDFGFYRIERKLSKVDTCSYIEHRQPFPIKSVLLSILKPIKCEVSNLGLYKTNTLLLKHVSSCYKNNRLGKIKSIIIDKMNSNFVKSSTSDIFFGAFNNLPRYSVLPTIGHFVYNRYALGCVRGVLRNTISEKSTQSKVITLLKGRFDSIPNTGFLTNDSIKDYIISYKKLISYTSCVRSSNTSRFAGFVPSKNLLNKLGYFLKKNTSSGAVTDKFTVTRFTKKAIPGCKLMFVLQRIEDLRRSTYLLRLSKRLRIRGNHKSIRKRSHYLHYTDSHGFNIQKYFLSRQNWSIFLTAPTELRSITMKLIKINLDGFVSKTLMWAYIEQIKILLTFYFRKLNAMPTRRSVSFVIRCPILLHMKGAKTITKHMLVLNDSFGIRVVNGIKSSHIILCLKRFSCKKALRIVGWFNYGDGSNRYRLLPNRYMFDNPGIDSWPNLLYFSQRIQLFIPSFYSINPCLYAFNRANLFKGGPIVESLVHAYYFTAVGFVENDTRIRYCKFGPTRYYAQLRHQMWVNKESNLSYLVNETRSFIKAGFVTNQPTARSSNYVFSIFKGKLASDSIKLRSIRSTVGWYFDKKLTHLSSLGNNLSKLCTMLDPIYSKNQLISTKETFNRISFGLSRYLFGLKFTYPNLGNIHHSTGNLSPHLLALLYEGFIRKQVLIRNRNNSVINSVLCRGMDSKLLCSSGIPSNIIQNYRSSCRIHNKLGFFSKKIVGTYVESIKNLVDFRTKIHTSRYVSLANRSINIGQMAKLMLRVVKRWVVYDSIEKIRVIKLVLMYLDELGIDQPYYITRRKRRSFELQASCRVYFMKSWILQSTLGFGKPVPTCHVWLHRRFCSFSKPVAFDIFNIVQRFFIDSKYTILLKPKNFIQKALHFDPLTADYLCYSLVKNCPPDNQLFSELSRLFLGNFIYKRNKKLWFCNFILVRTPTPALDLIRYTVTNMRLDEEKKLSKTFGFFIRSLESYVSRPKNSLRVLTELNKNTVCSVIYNSLVSLKKKFGSIPIYGGYKIHHVSNSPEPSQVIVPLSSMISYTIANGYVPDRWVKGTELIIGPIVIFKTNLDSDRPLGIKFVVNSCVLRNAEDNTNITIKQKKIEKTSFSSKLNLRDLGNDISRNTSVYKLDNGSVVMNPSYSDEYQYDYSNKYRSVGELDNINNLNKNYPYQKRLLWVNKQIILPIHNAITIITNSYDVIHSWFIPGLGLKMDCVPGRSTHHTIYIEHPGYYYGQCAEVCGRRHHHMPIKILAVPLPQFIYWWSKNIRKDLF